MSAESPFDRLTPEQLAAVFETYVPQGHGSFLTSNEGGFDNLITPPQRPLTKLERAIFNRFEQHGDRVQFIPPYAGQENVPFLFRLDLKHKLGGLLTIEMFTDPEADQASYMGARLFGSSVTSALQEANLGLHPQGELITRRDGSQGYRPFKLEQEVTPLSVRRGWKFWQATVGEVVAKVVNEVDGPQPTWAEYAMDRELRDLTTPQ